MAAAKPVGIGSDVREFIVNSAKSYSNKRMLDVFKALFEKLDSMTATDAVALADAKPVLYTLLGQDVFSKSWNVVWKALVCMPGFDKTYYEIGKSEAQLSPERLIPTIRTYLNTEIESYQRRIQIEQI